MAKRFKKDKTFQALAFLVLLALTLAACLIPFCSLKVAIAETNDPETLTENADLNGDGKIDVVDVNLLVSAWHGMYTPVPTSSVPTATPTVAPIADLEGFWVGDFTEYFSDVPGDATHRSGQFLWFAKVNGTKLTATGDDLYYPVTVTADIDGDLLTGTLKSFTNFNMWAVASIPDGATTSTPEIEGWLWGSKDGFNYNAEFLLKKTDTRPTPVPTATFTPVPTRTVTPQNTATITPTPTPTFFF